MDKKKVLIVEDMDSKQEDWAKALNGKVEIVSAFSISEAEERFQANPDIALIVMDACVPGDSPNTMDLVRKFRSTFKGPMIANSTCWDYRRALIGAGCDYEYSKYKVPKKVCEVLGL